MEIKKRSGFVTNSYKDSLIMGYAFTRCFKSDSIVVAYILSFSNWTGEGGGGGGGGDGETPMDCDVGIVGGGLAGLYMAESLLRHKKETKVCVFERDTRLGGRIYDYFFPQVPDESVG